MFADPGPGNVGSPVVATSKNEPCVGVWVAVEHKHVLARDLHNKLASVPARNISYIGQAQRKREGGHWNERGGAGVTEEAVELQRCSLSPTALSLQLGRERIKVHNYLLIY